MRVDTHLILGMAFGAVLLVSPLAWADGEGQCQPVATVT